MTIEEILSKVEKLVKDLIEPNAEQIDEKAIWPEENIRALQAKGLSNLVIPKKMGGLGQGLKGLAQVCEKIGEACPSTALCFGMHCVGSAVIVAKATKDHQMIIEEINQGRHLTTLALSEGGTGAHFYLPQTKLEITDNELKLNGEKHFVTNGSYADSYVISATTEDSSFNHEFSCVILPNETPGMKWGEQWLGLGMRGNQSRKLSLQNIHLPKSYLLGDEGDQVWYVFNVVAPYFLMAMSGTYLGVSNSAVQEAKKHLKNRKYEHSDESLSQVSVLQHKFGKMWAEVQKTKQLVYWAANEASMGSEYSLPAICSAKAEVAECCINTVNEAMTMCGGLAYRECSKFSRMLRDARASHVMAPTTDILRTWTGRDLLGEQIL